MPRGFAVRVTADGKPLASVQVEVETFRQKPGKLNKVVFKGSTGTDGAVRVPKLKPGRYTVDAEYLGLEVDDTCFDVVAHGDGKTEKEISFTWGDDAFSTGALRGKLTNGETDMKLSFAERLSHGPNAVPIPSATLSLRGPSRASPYTTVTDEDGNFSFSDVPDGVYVVHLDAGKSKSGIRHEHDDQIIRISGAAKADDLEWELGAAICGSAIFYFPARRGK